MEATLDQIEAKFKEIENRDGIFLCNLFLKWNNEKEEAKYDVENWRTDVATIKEKMKYLNITEVHQVPFGVTFKINDTYATLALKWSNDSIEFVKYINSEFTQKNRMSTPKG